MVLGITPNTKFVYSLSPSVEELFFSAKKGNQYIFYREIIQEAVCPEVLRILLHRYGS